MQAAKRARPMGPPPASASTDSQSKDYAASSDVVVKMPPPYVSDKSDATMTAAIASPSDHGDPQLLFIDKDPEAYELGNNVVSLILRENEFERVKSKFGAYVLIILTRLLNGVVM